MLSSIVQYTNCEIRKQSEKYKDKQCSYIDETNIAEIKAFIGLLYLAGAMKQNHLNLKILWSVELGISIYRTTMPLARFQFLMNTLRFDDKTTRQNQMNGDRFAAIRDLWSNFMTNCEKNYTPAEYCTIDEQLLAFRGRCSFKMYVPSKPNKYGIKILMMCDSKTYYMLSAIPYTGAQQQKGDEPLATKYVIELSKPIHGTYRNITMDNWFSSIPLADMMLQNHKITVVGTLRKNKAEIPPSFLANRARKPDTSLFAFNDKKCLVSYCPKRNKVVLLLSTMHSSPDVNDNSQKPEIVHFYNSTKGGVDTFDELCSLSGLSQNPKMAYVHILWYAQCGRYK